MGAYSWRSRGIITYQVLMPLLAGVCLFVLASVADRPRFWGSAQIDMAVRLALWGYVSWMYWGLGVALKHPSLHGWPTEIATTRSLVTLLTLLSGGVLHGLMMGLLTWWSLSLFVPQLPANTISLLNGLQFGILAFARFLLLPAYRSE